MPGQKLTIILVDLDDLLQLQREPSQHTELQLGGPHSIELAPEHTSALLSQRKDICFPLVAWIKQSRSAHRMILFIECDTHAGERGLHLL